MDSAQAHALNSAIRALTLRHRARAAELLAELGLHPGQEFVLMALAAKGPQVQRRLAEEIGCEPPTITHMVRKLEAAGHIARVPSADDRRATIVELTPQGRGLLGRLDEVWLTLAAETVAGIAGTSPGQIIDLLRDMAANLRPAGDAAVLEPPHAI
ncbi:MarR family winged helix-turn-helix transcriptional regulator [Paractinoplanes rhizophilus]|jgi:DNA-binding MarR family transcriptional regulator|uniref:MarR family winged helix-turn-helix transcriptional regulator n=1 Tax=Paractinoplanes rhizophilus TaxID=1416877 RepID=A0ABW2HKQ7_9ACTN|nr:MarR family winged helix-turn-helix transcriptional regulator [Actinoplanes sp.]